LFFDFVGDGIGKIVVGAGAGAGGIFEDEGVFIADFLHKISRSFKIFVGFAGEADDKVAGDSDVGYDLSGAINQV